MPTEALAALRADRSLFFEVLRFNLEPACYADPDRLAVLWPDGLSGAHWGRLLGAPRLAGRLSRHLLDRLGLGQDACWDFAPPRRRLALLPAAEITRIARFAGCFLAARAIAKVIARDAVAELRRQLGDDAYVFAVKRASFMAPPESGGPGLDAAAIERDGFACLGHWLAGEPPALALRLRLKLPPPGIPEMPPALPGPALAAQALDKVLKEGDPAWRAYCD